ncbi:MAG: hypothetical protein R3A52_29670 [Polyangiales bacterium]
MEGAFSRLALLVLSLAACHRGNADPAPPPAVVDAAIARTPPAPLPPPARVPDDVPPALTPATMGPGPIGPWQVTGSDTGSTSPAVWDGHFVVGAVAVPSADARSATLRWVHWGPRGPETVSEAEVPGVAPGVALDLAHVEGDQWTVTWMRPSIEVDAGGAWFSVDVVDGGVRGAAHAPRPERQAAAAWTQDSFRRRSREGARIPPPAIADANLRVDSERPRDPRVYLGDVLVTRGEDLLTYLPATAVATGPDGARWVALTRGRCRDSHVELYRVHGGSATLKASWAVAVEVAFRWMQVRPTLGAVVLTWYQGLIPIRMDCTRGEGAPGLADHGVRVAMFREP